MSEILKFLYETSLFLFACVIFFQIYLLTDDFDQIDDMRHS
jgi:hypothetical protein